LQKSNSELNNRKNKLNIINTKYGDRFYYLPVITHYISEINNSFINKIVSVCGRIFNYRNSKLFVLIRECGSDLQCYFDLKKDEFKEHLKLVDTGDIINVTGIIKESSTKVITLFVSSFKIASKCLIHAPDQYYLQNYEDVYTSKTRTNYLTFCKPAFCALYLRSKILNYTRNYFLKNNFLEVETPVLQRIAGGASATPFTTTYIDKKDIFQLRIAPELYLKKHIIAGFTKIFEIAKNFRNEGISVSHNPEFTMLETYVTYWKLQSMIDFKINLIRHIVDSLIENDQQYLTTDQLSFLKSVDFNNVAEYDFLHIIEDNFGKNVCEELLIKDLAKNNIVYDHDNIPSFYDLCDDYISKVFVKKLNINTLCIIKNHPKALSPLSKYSNHIAHRCEIYFGKYEIVDMFEENNDSELQHNIFKEQQKQNNREYDINYINDMCLGFPYTTGSGIGFDRLVCLLLGYKNIKDIISYTD